MHKGKQRKIPTPGTQKRHHLFGAYNWRTNEVIYMTAERKHSITFCLFLEHLIRSVTSSLPIVIVLDNASYHHSHISEAMLAYFEDRSMVCWLPPYCSDLNPIERFWRHLKETACANRLFKHISEIVDSVAKVLSILNDLTHPDRFLFSKT